MMNIIDTQKSTNDHPYQQGFSLAVNTSQYLFSFSFRPQQNATSPIRLSKEGMKLQRRQNIKFFFVSSSSLFFISINFTPGSIIYYIFSPPWMKMCRKRKVTLIWLTKPKVFSVIPFFNSNCFYDYLIINGFINDYQLISRKEHIIWFEQKYNYKKNMENTAKLGSFEQSSETANSDENKSDLKKQQSTIYQFDWFPMTQSPWIASVSFIFQLFLVIQSMDFYADIAGLVFNNQNSFKILSTFIVPGIESIPFIFSTLFSVLSILTLIFNKTQEAEGYKYLLGWIGSKLFPLLRYIIDLNLAISAIFMIRIPIVSVLFLIAGVINIGINFFCQNYTLRKDYLCCKSMSYMLIWKVSVTLGYILNSIGYYLITNRTSLIILLSAQFILFLTVFIFYFLFGYLIYRHTSSQIMLLLLLNLFCAVTMANLYDAILSIVNNEFVSNRNLVFSGCFFVFLSFLSYSLWTNIKKYGSALNTKDPIKRIYFLFNKLENSSQNINDDCQIRGIIRYHLCHQCNNINCFINKGEQSYFDAKKNSSCYSNKLNQGKTSFVKLIAKCLYEQELDATKWNSTDLFLNYIQFYFMKLKNLFQVCILLAELQKRFLTPFQKIRLVRLRKVMMEENRKLNEQLYNGSLDLQNLIVSENKFDQIQVQLKDVLCRNIDFWKYMENDTINLSTMVKMLQPNFLLIDKINNNWKNIAKYFEIQKVWKFLFVSYTLYFRNQKLKPQFIEQFGQSVHEDELFSLESLHIDKTTQTSKLCVSKMIFEQDVCCIHINHSQEKPIIKSVSRYFQRIFGYQSNQIIESPLDIMMTPSFRSFHKKKFLKWAGQGKSNKENNYEIKKVFPVNKNGSVVSTFKFYKQFLCLNKELEYVAMFKKNKEEQNVIILNEHYEIEGMTESLIQKLEISNKEYRELIGLNILILLPSLIEYTKFDEQKQHINDDLLGVIMECVQKSTVTYQSERSRNKKVSINAKKQFTKNNILLTIPSSFDQIREVYISSNQQSNLSKLTAICRGHKLLRELEIRRKLKIQIEVRLIKVEDNSYIQFYIRQIESADKNNEVKSVDVKSYYEKQSIMNEEMINEEDINRFFQTSHNSQNFSLSFNDNIFIKQDNNQPVQMISHVQSISLYVRIIFVLFSALLVTSLLYQYNNYDNYKSNSQKSKAMVSLQLKMLIMDNKYHSQILGVDVTRRTVENLTNGMRQIREKTLQFKKSLLDGSINVPRNYSIDSQGTIKTYDQVDIIDKMFESLIQIVYSGNLTSDISAYEQYKNLAIPSLEVLTTNAMDNISKVFDQVNKQIEIKNNIYIGIGLILLIVGFLLVLSSLIKISKSFISLMEIFTQFNESDLKKIIKYCVTLELLFSQISRKYNQLKNKVKASSKQGVGNDRNYSYPASSLKLANSNMSDGIVNDLNQEQDNANLNKKVKKVENGKELTHLKLKSIVYVIIFLVLYGISSFGLNLYTSVINKEIIQYKEAGHDIFQYFSAINIYLISMKDRATEQSQFNSSKYDTYRQKINEMRNLKFASGSSLNSYFINIKNSILFGNVCEIFPDALTPYSYTSADCQNVAQNNLQHGLQSFLFYMVFNVDFYLSSSSYVFDRKILIELQTGLEICNIYLQYLLESWSSYFLVVVYTLQRNIIIICCSLFVFQVIIYIVLIEILIVGNLKQKFMFFKKIYNNMMPDFIVTKQKIIKAKLQVEGFINK